MCMCASFEDSCMCTFPLTPFPPHTHTRTHSYTHTHTRTHAHTHTHTQFEYSEDLNAVLGEPESPEHLTLSKLAALLPTALFKFYLRRIILTSIKSTEDPIQSVLLFYNKTEVSYV